jgi:hypothetical protein
MMTPCDWWLLLVTLGDSPVQKNHEYIGINNYPQIPFFSKVVRSDQKTAKKQAKVGDRRHFNNKKAPKLCGGAPAVRLGVWLRQNSPFDLGQVHSGETCGN